MWVARKDKKKRVKSSRYVKSPHTGRQYEALLSGGTLRALQQCDSVVALRLQLLALTDAVVVATRDAKQRVDADRSVAHEQRAIVVNLIDLS